MKVKPERYMLIVKAESKDTAFRHIVRNLSPEDYRYYPKRMRHSEDNDQVSVTLVSTDNLTMPLNEWFHEDLPQNRLIPGYGYPQGSLLYWSNLDHHQTVDRSEGVRERSGVEQQIARGEDPLDWVEG